MEDGKTRNFYKISLVIVLCGLICYFLQEIYVVLIMLQWMTQTVFFIIGPFSNLAAIISLIIFIKFVIDNQEKIKTKRLAIFFALVSGLIQIINYLISPLIDEPGGFPSASEFLSIYPDYDFNFILLIVFGITLIFPFIVLIVNGRKEEETILEKIAYIPVIIMLIAFDIVSEHLTRYLFFRYDGLSSGYLFIPRIVEIIFAGLLILLIMFDVMYKNKKIIRISKSIFMSIFFLVSAALVTYATYYYFTGFSYFPITLGNISMIIGSIMLAVATVLVIKMKLKEEKKIPVEEN